MSQAPSSATPDLAGHKADLLMQCVGALDVPYGYERSFRLSDRILLAHRFLITLNKLAIGPQPHARIRDICQRMEMPEAFLEATGDYLGAAKFVHFGFEGSSRACLYKVYLEFGSSVDGVVQSATNGSTPVLLYVAFKWDVSDPSRHAVTRYVWYPSLSVPGIRDRLVEIYDGGGHEESLDIATGILECAASRMAPEDIRYMEVSEDQNPRRSFDINLYDADLQMRDLHPFLSRMYRQYNIPDASFHALYDQIKTQTFGHLAGGLHRQGQDFFNVYYGAVGRRGGRQSPGKTAMTSLGRLEYTTREDPFFNYCLWKYTPVAPIENKFRPVNLLFHSFEVAGLDARAVQLVQTIRDAIGSFRTVWGSKWLDNRLAWEFYFYDYMRREREVSITRVLEAIRPLIKCDIRVNESLPYFMFSLDVDGELLSGHRDLDVVQMYIGNPGSTVSSGIAYAVTAEETTLNNFYFFFDAKGQLQEAAEKICCSAHVDAAQIDVNRILLPELRNCQTICVSNKRGNDTVYFSGVNVDQLLFFLNMLDYPLDIIGFVADNRGNLDHLLYDVGFDYIAEGEKLVILKSGFYGVF